MYNRYLQNSCSPQESKKPCSPPKYESSCEQKHGNRHQDPHDWDDRKQDDTCRDSHDRDDHKHDDKCWKPHDWDDQKHNDTCWDPHDWDDHRHEKGSLLSSLGSLFGGKEGGRLSKLLDDNTLLVLLILYFLLKDEDGIDHDLLLLAGIFLLLGF